MRIFHSRMFTSVNLCSRFNLHEAVNRYVATYTFIANLVLCTDLYIRSYSSFAGPDRYFYKEIFTFTERLLFLVKAIK